MTPLSNPLRVLAIVTCTTLLSACGGGGASGGGGGLTPSIPTNPVVTATATPSNIQPMTVISSGPDNQLAVSGTIVELRSDGFQLEAGQGVGYFNVTTSSATTYTDFTPAVGDFVES